MGDRHVPLAELLCINKGLPLSPHHHIFSRPTPNRTTRAFTVILGGGCTYFWASLCGKVLGPFHLGKQEWACMAQPSCRDPPPQKPPLPRLGLTLGVHGSWAQAEQGAMSRGPHTQAVPMSALRGSFTTTPLPVRRRSGARRRDARRAVDMALSTVCA